MKRYGGLLGVVILVCLLSFQLKAQDFKRYDFYEPINKKELIKEKFADKQTYNWIEENQWYKSTFSEGNMYLECKNFKRSSGLSVISTKINPNQDFQIETEINVKRGAGGLIFGMAEDNYDHFRIELTPSKNKLLVINNLISQNQLEKVHELKLDYLTFGVSKLTVRKVNKGYYLYLNERLIMQMNIDNLHGNRIGYSVGVKSAMTASYLNVCQLESLSEIAEKKVPSLTVSNIVFEEKKNNKAIDINENCSLSFTISNSGRTDARNLQVFLADKNNTPDIDYKRSVSVMRIEAGGAETVTFPIYGRDIKRHGEANFAVSFSLSEGNGPENFEYKVGVKTITVKSIVEDYINKRIEEWIVKGKFETSSEYKERVNYYTRKEKVQLYKNEIVNQLAKEKTNLKLKTNEYDADNRTFKIIFESLPEIYLQMPSREEAISFDANFRNLKFLNPEYNLTSSETFSLRSVDVMNDNFDTTYMYFYSASTPVTFKTFKIENNFEEIKLDLTGEIKEEVNKGDVVINTQDADIETVDDQIPLYEGEPKKNTFALIIGNEDYTKFQTSLTNESNVDFAINDARIFSQYCKKTLGIPAENITLLQDAISSKMKREIETLKARVKYADNPADVEVIIYYSGHGFPDENKEGYIMPVDISGANVKDGIKLSKLYEDFSQLGAKRVTFFLDACFSGGGRTQGLLAAKAIRVKAKQNIMSTGNIVVFSASGGDQESLFYKEKEHGIFTYFLLKKLQETKGNVTYGEIANFVKRKVPLISTTIYSKVQKPEVNTSQDLSASWRILKIRE